SPKGLSRLLRTVWGMPLVPDGDAERLVKTVDPNAARESAAIAREPDAERVRARIMKLLLKGPARVGREIGSSLQTALLITAATAASMVKSQADEMNLRSGALLPSEEPQQNKVAMNDLSVWEDFAIQ